MKPVQKEQKFGKEACSFRSNFRICPQDFFLFFPECEMVKALIGEKWRTHTHTHEFVNSQVLEADLMQVRIPPLHTFV